MVVIKIKTDSVSQPNWFLNLIDSYFNSNHFLQERKHFITFTASQGLKCNLKDIYWEFEFKDENEYLLTVLKYS